ncbi:hypothetical protein EBH_0072420 [Eimeria brunetti]|uniref:Retrotransposon gag domain-containing protein n=1 Tax=Eimeria brunetti TaxID=51314 RepID=U6LDP2_9EIME|nr:hypothetical protein EBH_0072420 [Eimeria brunetti]
MDIHLRNGKVVQPPPEPNAGMPNIVVSGKETTGHPIESKRTEPGRDISQPITGVGRPRPRNRDRDVGGRKEPEMNQAWMEPGMAEFFWQFASQMALGLGHTSQRSIGFEDGKNMRNFLDLVELDFIERGLETDWEQLRQQFCAQFCNITKERMKVMIAENVCGGDRHACSARFATIVAQGVSIAQDLLVGYYLGNLPVEIYREITRGGTRKFADWQEAAAALATTAAPWRDSCEDRFRFQRDLEDAKRR